MPRTPEIRQSILDFLAERATDNVTHEPISGMYKVWKARHLDLTTSDRAFRQAINNLKIDGYIDYTSTHHKVGPIRIVETRVARPCPVNGNHVYVCACGKESAW